MSTRKFQVALAVMFSGRAEVSLPTKEEMAAGADPEVGLYSDSIGLFPASPTINGQVVSELSPEECVLAAQLVYNALTMHCTRKVAEATQVLLDKHGKVSVDAAEMFPQSGGAKA